MFMRKNEEGYKYKGNQEPIQNVSPFNKEFYGSKGVYAYRTRRAKQPLTGEVTGLMRLPFL